MSNNIQKALNIVQKYLSDFADRENSWDDFKLAFGPNYNKKIALNIKKDLASQTHIFPKLEVLSHVDRQTIQKVSDIPPPKLITPDDVRTVIPLHNDGRQKAIVPSTGNSILDALLNGYQWGVTTINYSFYSGGSYYGEEAVASVSEAVKNSVRAFLENAIEPLINVNFVEVTDSPTSYGQIRYLQLTNPAPDEYAYAYRPNSTDANQGNSKDIAGDIFLNFNNDNALDTNGFQGGPGTHGYNTLIHETLHALGLKHPGDYNGSGPGQGPFLPFNLDNLDNTIMSYNFSPNEPATPMAYDLLALQYLYGAKAHNNSNTTYTFSYIDLYSDGIQTVGGLSTSDSKLTMWDSGGVDTLNFSALEANSGGYRFDLNEGGWLTRANGFNGGTYTALGDTSGTNYAVTVAGTRLGYGVAIENAIGTNSNDSFIGNTLNNTFTGGRGNDNIAGGGGNDLAIYTGTRAQYQIVSTGLGNYTITDLTANRDGVDTLSSIESVRFSDGNLNPNTLPPQLAIDNVTIVEGNSGTKTAVFTVSRVGATNVVSTVTYTTANGTATAGTDYTSKTGLLTFAIGETSKTISIAILGDTTIEANEIFFVNLSGATNATIDDAQGQGTIDNDDSNDNFANRSILTGNTINITGTNIGATGEIGEINHAGVSGNLTEGTSGTLNSVWWSWKATANGTLTINTAGSNFDTTLGVYTGSSVSTLTTIASSDDVTAGVIQTSAVTFQAISGTTYQIAVDGFAAETGNINLGLNFTPVVVTPPAISIADITIVEGIAGNPTQSLVTISLSKASTGSVSVNYATSNVTAIAGTDYTATTGTLTFAAGQTSKTIAVPILNNDLNEANETFEITLSAPTNATIADNKAIVTITDTFSTSVTSTLAALVENITLTGTSAINGTANAGNNVLIGNAANNTLTGLNGDDTYSYDADLVQGIDRIAEITKGGNDTLDFTSTTAAVNINLGLTTTQTVNTNLKLVIPVLSLENVFGGGGNDRIAGNSLNNSLYGGTGDDRIYGAGGDDTIYGQAGNDIISGGAGNDLFAYNGALSGAITANALFGLDTISDFTSTQDKISLSKSTFGAITSKVGAAMGGNFIAVDDDSLVATQSAAIVYSLNSGSLFYNQNGVAAGFGTNGGEFATFLNLPTLVGTDFTVAA